jgi:hypothetical protein
METQMAPENHRQAGENRDGHERVEKREDGPDDAFRATSHKMRQAEPLRQAARDFWGVDDRRRLSQTARILRHWIGK